MFKSHPSAKTNAFTASGEQIILNSLVSDGTRTLIRWSSSCDAIRCTTIARQLVLDIADNFIETHQTNKPTQNWVHYRRSNTLGFRMDFASVPLMMHGSSWHRRRRGETRGTALKAKKSRKTILRAPLWIKCLFSRFLHSQIPYAALSACKWRRTVETNSLIFLTLSALQLAKKIADVNIYGSRFRPPFVWGCLSRGHEHLRILQRNGVPLRLLHAIAVNRADWRQRLLRCLWALQGLSGLENLYGPALPYWGRSHNLDVKKNDCSRQSA